MPGMTTQQTVETVDVRAVEAVAGSVLGDLAGLTNGVLSALCAVELPLFPINRLAGLSAFVLAKKP